MGVLRLRWTGVVRSELWIEVDEKGIRVNRIEVGLMVSSIGIGIGIGIERGGGRRVRVQCSRVQF